MNPSPGYKYSSANQVCRLKKSLYGLKQAPRSWFENFLTTILGAGFTQSISDYSLFLYRSSSASLINNQTAGQVTKTTLKPSEVVHGIPTLLFTMEEREDFAREEGLHQAIIVKVSPNAPDLQDLRTILPKLFGVKGQCLIGLLAQRQLLIRLDHYDDFVICLTRSVTYFTSKEKEHQVRVFPWTIRCNPKEETHMAAVWISFPSLPPELFARRALMSIAATVGKPIAIDKATQLRSRPSTARVKVILDILEKHPEQIRLKYVDEGTGKIVEQLQQVTYDNLPLYCNHCKHQGHDESNCRILLGKNE
uniref:Uncharacterized protein LOC104240602 n=1 Tax=Nicotiana sylvestris TaxID=4096 RepID=A0A1U7XP00_NICSY|nr:PREDICTED: uncharacterized protein LOC104240602 [Nicotiana sylvestris]